MAAQPKPNYRAPLKISNMVQRWLDEADAVDRGDLPPLGGWSEDAAAESDSDADDADTPATSNAEPATHQST